MLLIRNLHKSYGSQLVLRGVDLSVARGDAVVLIGPSGSGKSTLLSCINFLEPFEQGEIRVDGEPVGWTTGSDGMRLRQTDRELDRLRRGIGIVFQQFNLFPHLTVLENLTLAPVLVRRCPKAEVRSRALELLERVGIAEQADKYPGQLSGGQQQRVAIARSLCMEPRILLFDEPTSALDPEMVQEVLEVMQELAAEGMTMVVVTHEVRFARQVASRVVLMAEGDVVEVAPPEQFFTNPQHERSRQFLSQIG